MENPSLQILTEAILPIQTEARLLVTYKELESINLNAYKLSDRQYKKFIKLYRHERILKMSKPIPLEKYHQ